MNRSRPQTNNSVQLSIYCFAIVGNILRLGPVTNPTLPVRANLSVHPPPEPLDQADTPNSSNVLRGTCQLIGFRNIVASQGLWCPWSYHPYLPQFPVRPRPRRLE